MGIGEYRPNLAARRNGETAQDRVEGTGKIMLRNDILQVTVGSTMAPSKPLKLGVASDKAIQVRCVDDYFGKTNNPN